MHQSINLIIPPDSLKKIGAGSLDAGLAGGLCTKVLIVENTLDQPIEKYGECKKFLLVDVTALRQNPPLFK